MTKEKLIKYSLLGVQIFLIGLLIHFFVQTFVTFELGLSGTFRTIIWLWKEVLLLAGVGVILWLLFRTKKWQTFWLAIPLKKFSKIFVGTIVFTAIVTIFVTNSGLDVFILSARYNFTGFFVFALGFFIARLLFDNKQLQLVDRYRKILKILVVLGICRRAMLRMLPRLLDFFGYNKNVFEGEVGAEPPAAYYTEINQGYVRNQFLFERPISRGFFLIAFRPLFFITAIKNRKWSTIALRGGLYGLNILSTFSRAARIARIIQTGLLILLMHRKQWRKLGLYMFIPLLILFGAIAYVGREQVIHRSFSTLGHIKHTTEAFHRVQEKPFWGRGAGSAGPVTHQVEDIEEYNPENQFLQVWLEYGLWGFLGWFALYLYLHLIGRKAYKYMQNSKLTKQQRYLSRLVVSFSIGMIGLTIEGMFLHSFIDRMIVYPMMILFGIIFAIYWKNVRMKKGEFVEIVR